MKALRIALIAASIVMSVSAYSQTDTTKKDVMSTDQTTNTTTVTGQSTTEQSTTTANTQVFPKPNFGRYYIPVIGSYTSSTETTEAAKNVTIAGDEENPGKIWIEGLTSEKIYALRKPGKGLYKIPAQKVADKSFAEGTVMYDDNSKQVNICLGCNYKDASPTDAFTHTEESTSTNTGTSKNHKAVKTNPVLNFTGNKTNAGTAALN